MSSFSPAKNMDLKINLQVMPILILILNVSVKNYFTDDYDYDCFIFKKYFLITSKQSVSV